ncbi:putative SET domain-containing protein 5 [Glarea lozoyensis 74030]|uniref:Putative SET domain-containing protein 5 n=1 Tax=Glarea lozoyensis (strain ATCC 74030 / MF5533) TaxID=1104152 RepID=H0EM03_GLAL7|nr:putative SET domain-containing protein 5 [Glarea lozoyensis 74030]
MLLEGNIAETKMHHSTGIWLKASKVNHSCMANCKRSFIGDLQIIRATQDILANTELFFWYREPTCDYADMKKEMQHWGFECTCNICDESKNLVKDISRKRKTLLIGLQRSIKQKHVSIERVERQLKVYEATFKKPATELPRMSVFNIYIALSKFYGKTQQLKNKLRDVKDKPRMRMWKTRDDEMMV